MSNIVDSETSLSLRIARERTDRGWSLAQLAERSGVSRSMLSKIERQESSPTATVLLRIAAAFGVTLAELLTEPASAGSRVLRAADQPAWIDPATGYRRRQVYLSAGLPLELVDVELPPGARVAAPAASYALIRQVLWVLEGALVVQEGELPTTLGAGDRLEFGPPSDVVFRNESGRPCRYLVAVLRW
ncbi:XRE family transcriptional regulator [uncultured Phenylobacterium sp.]|uniref:helix-turn-helix domain-containing protein n=1 Tax=uncultured Phenylobacterium sp. TaxID=349273 RepID=UPI0025D145F6|nr:XRE family transcriptional regulator [uncultured Phenylobacterium sp.]